MEQQQRRRHRRAIHSRILSGIARLSDPQLHEARHRLTICGRSNMPRRVNRRSVQHLVNFLDDGDSHHEVTELALGDVQISRRGVDVLRSFFARSDTTVTQVSLAYVYFGNEDDTLRLVRAFHTNRTVVDLYFFEIEHLEGARLGTLLSDLLQNVPQLQRISCSGLRVEGVRAFQPALRANRTLTTLDLSCCSIGDDGIRLIADALVGNTTMRVFDISYNEITSNGLDDIISLLESTRLQTIDLDGNDEIFDDENATQRFVSTLQHKKSTVQELLGIDQLSFYESPDSREATYAIATSIVTNSLVRNQSLNKVNLLLAPPQSQQQQQQQRNAGTIMMLKTWHKAITKFATVSNNAGASAIFTLFQARPQILEKRIKRPAVAAAVAAAVAVAPQDGNRSSKSNQSSSSTSTKKSSQPTKRRRL